MSGEDAEWADLILAMEKVHVRAIGQLYPGARGKVRLLGKHIPSEKGTQEIQDPFGGSREDYSAAQFKIFLAVQNLAIELTGEETP